MTPLFTSHYSVGKSILTLDKPSEFSDGPDSIFSIAKASGLKEVYLVDENCSGVFEAIKNAKAQELQLKFGIKMNMISGDEKHKIVIFAKNAKGVFDLFEIFSSSSDGEEVGIDEADLAKFDMSNLALVVPFYDSYLFKNMFEFKTIVPRFPVDPLYITENNNLPCDHLLKNKINSLNVPVWLCKTIFYKDKADFEAWQVYKIACAREAGKKRTLDCPNLQWCGSDEFCWESYVEESK